MNEEVKFVWTTTAAHLLVHVGDGCKPHPSLWSNRQLKTKKFPSILYQTNSNSLYHPFQKKSNWMSDPDFFNLKFLSINFQYYISVNPISSTLRDFKFICKTITHQLKRNKPKFLILIPLSLKFKTENSLKGKNKALNLISENENKN